MGLEFYNKDAAFTRGLSTNWYKSFPYGFRFVTPSGTQYTVFLPLAPQNINITTHYATNVVATLYGTIEEHSEQRYFDIVIEGTTGIAPMYDALPTDELEQGIADTLGLNGGRKSAELSTLLKLPDLGGFFNDTLGRFQNAINQVSDLTSKEPLTGVAPDKSGYAAFHNLYNFFRLHKASIMFKKIDELLNNSGPPDFAEKTKENQAKLLFINYKDGNKYRCVIQRFVMRRSAADPMLYNYSIVLRAYDLRAINKVDISLTEINRQQRLGLDGVKSSSLLSEIRDLSDTVKNVVGVGAGGVIGFGR